MKKGGGHMLVLGAYPHCVGFFGSITSRKMVRALMCHESIFNAININTIAFSHLLFYDSIQQEEWCMTTMLPIYGVPKQYGMIKGDMFVSASCPWWAKVMCEF